MLPAERGRRGRPAKPNRVMLNAILWILRTGSPCRDLPRRFGPWNSVYTRFRRWVQQGVWNKVFQELSKEVDAESFMIDGTIVRAHQDATGAEKKTDHKPSVAPAADRARRSTPKWTP
jgi:transposase